MIQHPTRWLRAMLPHPWNPNNNNQNQEKGCLEEQNDPCRCPRLEECMIMEENCNENYSEGYHCQSPDLQVNSDIVNAGGLKMEEQNMSVDQCEKVSEKQKNTLANLIESISFERKKQIRKKQKQKNMQKSETSSRSSISSYDGKSVKSQQSKCWNQQQQDLFYQLVEKYGTDFNFIKQYFPKKSKSQIKNKYKQIANMKRKNKKFLQPQQKPNEKKQQQAPNLSMQENEPVVEIKEINQDQSQSQLMK